MSVWSEVKDAVVVSCYCVAKPFCCIRHVGINAGARTYANMLIIILL